MKEDNSYILGTDSEELHRLGIQHQVWASEAQTGWKLGGFTAGQTLLDLGCGPGFCTKELAFMVGEEGKVIGVDRSAHFIEFLKAVSSLYTLNIDPICADFDELDLDSDSLDGMYCRWALAWIANPEAILSKVKDALKVGGRMVIHEYYDWSTLQTQPSLSGLTYGIETALRSLKEQEGEIDIGRHLPQLLESMGMKIVHKRLMNKMATPNDFNWQWPNSFFKSYFPRLIETGYLTAEEVAIGLNEMKQLSAMKEATLFGPAMIEVVAEKIS